MSEEQWQQKLDKDIKAGQLDDILARIDSEYATYNQIPVFICQEDELAYWSRIERTENETISSTLPTRQPDP